MRRQILFCIVLIFCLTGCGATMQCYQMPDYPKICIFDKESFLAELPTLENKANEYLEQGYTLLILQESIYFANMKIITGFYIEEKDLIYSINDMHDILLLLWFRKNNILPIWPLGDRKVFRVNHVGKKKEHHE